MMATGKQKKGKGCAVSGTTRVPVPVLKQCSVTGYYSNYLLSSGVQQ